MSAEAAPRRGVLQWVEEAAVLLLLLAVSLGVLYPLLRESITWRAAGEGPVQLYAAWEMHHQGRVPYRDILTTEAPGYYVALEAMGKGFGWDDAGPRRGILALLALIALAGAGALWRFGLRGVWAGALLFAFLFLRQGAGVSITPEAVALLPLALAIAIAGGCTFIPPQWRALLSGIFVGAAATIAPLMVGALPLIAWLPAEEECETPQGWRVRCISLASSLLLACLGALLPLLACAGYLLYHGAFGSFWQMATHYWPLAWEIAGDKQVLPASNPAHSLPGRMSGVGDAWLLLTIGGAGLAVAWANARAGAQGQRLVSLLWMLLLGALAYAAWAGPSWREHYLPLAYVCSLGAGLAFAAYDSGAPWQQRLVPIVIIALGLCHMLRPHEGYPSLRGGQAGKNETLRVDAVAQFLKANLEPGDTVQAIDWTEGGICHALLLAQAPHATPYLQYHAFMHHVDSPYILTLRNRFVESLKQAAPRFVVRALPEGGSFLRPGQRVARQFPQAEQLWTAGYTERVKRPGFIIYERKGAGSDGIATP